MSKYLTVKPYDTANGDGIRVSIFFSGCPHCCDECFNKESWDKNNGNIFNNSITQEIIELLSKPYIRGLSILGGEPMVDYNIKDVLELCSTVKNIFPNKDIYVWTGYNFEYLVLKYGVDNFKNIDYVIDGLFEKDKKNITLKWRGSSNQKIWKNINGTWIIKE